MTDVELTKIIIGYAIEVYKALGPGLLEKVYQECLHYKLNKEGILTEKEKAISVVFEEVKIDCGFRVDLLVENRVVIECKSVKALDDVHLAQILTYLKLGGFKTGLLINFNVPLLKDGIQRVVNGY
jgi:GxxExxY protein